MKRFLIIAGICAILTLYTLTLSTNSNSSLSTFFWTIVLFCIVLILGLCSIIIRYIVKIIRDKHNRVFGSQIARKLSLMFTVITVIPALFVLSVSAQLISHNINSWFGNDTKQALERSLHLSKSALDRAVGESAEQAKTIVNDIVIARKNQTDITPTLLTQQAKTFSQLSIWNLDTPTIVKQYNPEQLRQPEPDQTTLQHLRRNATVRSVENINNRLYARGWLRLPDTDGQAQALFFRQAIPETVAQDAELIEAARAKYAELVFAKKGLQTLFMINLVIATILTMLLALATALYFAQRFVEPILLLATGARAVAQGDFQQRIVRIPKDELGKLANLFNYMSEQLAIAKDKDEQHRQKQEAARHYLERVLNSLSSGVITLDDTGRLNTYNSSAEAILDVSLQDLLCQNSRQWAHRSPQHTVLAETFNALLNTETSEEAAEIPYSGADESRILLGKAIRMPPENGNGIVLVFDNITTLVLAQKEAAWGEVAKRLAHEIRNPLTPIQLSAERLALKLSGKISEKDEQILLKSTDTIIKQVASLKEMVEAFRNYARAPSLRMNDINLNQLVSEVLVLYESTPCAFIPELSNIELLLKADTTAMRQVLHNLLKNAAEAAESDKHPEVHIHTCRNEQGEICLSISNNGKSFSKSMLKSALDPYTTDKASGTGLGLSVVKKIVEDHKGKITLANQETGGACVTLKFNMENQ